MSAALPWRILLALGLSLFAGLAAPGTTDAAFAEIEKLTASDGGADDQFGWRVAVSGDTAVVGAWLDGGDVAFAAGSAYVLQRNEGGADNWGEVRKLLASDASFGDRFGGGVALSGDTLIVGAPFENSAGAAYVFQRNEGGADNWGEVKKLISSDIESGDEFGWTVSVSGNTVVVGASGEDAGGDRAGAAYVFQRNEGGADNWGEVKKLTASDTGPNVWFGFSVSISGETAVMGGFRDASNTGAAYVFQRNEGGADNWGEVKKLTASDADSNDQFGYSVSVSGEAIAVGARFEDGPCCLGGAAYVFQRNQGGANNWGEVKKLTLPLGGGNFGNSVALGGDTAVVGALAVLGQAGAAYIFQRNEGGADNWGDVKDLSASDAQAGDTFGRSVAVSGDTALVGASREGALGTNAGAAYVFQEQPHQAVIRISPISQKVVGEDVVVEVRLDDIQELGAYEFEIQYEPSVLTFASVENGPFLGSTGRSTLCTPIVPAEVLGTVRFGCLAPGPPPPEGASGSGLLATVRFTACAGHSEFHLTNATTVTVVIPLPGKVVPFTLEDGSVEVNGAGPCSTPTSTPAATGLALDSELRSLPLEATEPNSSRGAIAVSVVAAASLVAVGGAAWYARRRWLN